LKSNERVSSSAGSITKIVLGTANQTPPERGRWDNIKGGEKSNSTGEVSTFPKEQTWGRWFWWGGGMGLTTQVTAKKKKKKKPKMGWRRDRRPKSSGGSETRTEKRIVSVNYGKVVYIVPGGQTGERKPGGGSNQKSWRRNSRTAKSNDRGVFSEGKQQIRKHRRRAGN